MLPTFPVELHFVQSVTITSLFLGQGSFLAVVPSLLPVHMPGIVLTDPKSTFNTNTFKHKLKTLLYLDAHEL